MNNTTHILLCLVLICCLLSGCTKDSNELSNLDLRLELVLDKDGGISNFLLPDSENFTAIPQDPRNPITTEKVALGKLLFHETGIALDPKQAESKGSYSCASCHHAQGGFQACLPQGIGEGGLGFGFTGEQRVPKSNYMVEDLDVQPIRTPSALNAAYQRNMLWNGQFGSSGVNFGTEAHWLPDTPIATNELGYEGVEIQAIAGLDVHRLVVDSAFIPNNEKYQQMFAEAFPNVSREVRMTDEYAGLAIAAYERTLLANQSPFQKWLRGEHGAMSKSEKRGALLFFSKAKCGSCHTGPALNVMNFYALGMSDLDEVPGTYSVDTEHDAHKGRGGFTKRNEDMYKFKVPQLYNLKDSPFYGHGASFTDIRSVVAYKNAGIPQNVDVPNNQLAEEFKPLGLTESEITDITNFIENALYDPNLVRYVPTGLPSDQCFPNNDEVSKADLGCQ